MIWLVLGVVLWSAVHVLPMAARGPRAKLVQRLGEDPYKGVFSLALVLAIALMVIGWRSSAPIPVYDAPAWGRTAATPLMAVALLLFAASAVPTNLKRLLRHPQLSGLALWAGAHLLANGDRRSLVLFGGLGLWAIVSMLLINQRDGAWVKPDSLPASAEMRPILAALVGFAVLYFAHPYLFGVSPAPG